MLLHHHRHSFYPSHAVMTSTPDQQLDQKPLHVLKSLWARHWTPQCPQYVHSREITEDKMPYIYKNVLVTCCKWVNDKRFAELR